MKSTIEAATKKAFEEIAEARAFEATTKRAEQDPRCKVVEMELIDRLDNLRGMLNEEQQNLLDDIADSCNAVQAFWQEQAYMQGLEDSPLLSKELNKYGIQ